MESQRNILSVDVEEWFHYEYLKRLAPKTALLPKIIPGLLELFAKNKATATFFVVGSIAEKHPAMIESIYDAGHEIASHSYSHNTLWELGSTGFEKDLAASVRAIKNIVRKKPIGYRAPYWSIDEKTSWAIDILKKNGFKYDASIFPTKTPLYGCPKAPLSKYHPSEDNFLQNDSESTFIEYPLSLYSIAGIRIPFLGGFYLRTLPLFMAKAMLRSLNRKSRQGIVYFHPWEAYGNVPRIPGLTTKERFISYNGVTGMAKKLDSLLKEFKFCSFEEDLEHG